MIGLPNGSDYEGEYKGNDFLHYLHEFVNQAKEFGLDEKQIEILKHTLVCACKCSEDETLKVSRILMVSLDHLYDTNTDEYDFLLDNMEKF